MNRRNLPDFFPRNCHLRPEKLNWLKKNGWNNLFDIDSGHLSKELDNENGFFSSREFIHFHRSRRCGLPLPSPGDFLRERLRESSINTRLRGNVRGNKKM